jgi:hypothetical protein
MGQLNIQATRATAASGTAVIAPPVRVYSISIASNGGGAGLLELTTTSNSGTTILHVDVPTTEIYTLAFDGGVLFPAGVFCKTFTNLTGFTLFSDKYSGTGLT